MWVSAVFWSSAALVTYTYVGYPALMGVLARVRRRDGQRSNIEPTVSIVLAARNEEARIAAKLENLLSLDYPPEKRQIIVVSDGSEDRTDRIVAGYEAKGVRLLHSEGRGKPAALNHAVRHATGEILLFCDTRQRIDRSAVRVLVQVFADQEVGAVSGELELPSELGPGVYWKYEKFIRSAESRFDSVVGATGALYAIRRQLFREIPETSLLDDVFTPLQIVLQGYRVLFEPRAKVFDVEADLQGEFSRKARTLAGNYQLLEHLPELLNPFENRLFLQFVSHKLLRLLCPFALGTLLGANVILVCSNAVGWPIFLATLAGQGVAYGLALRGALSPNGGRFARVSYTFLVLNAAAVEGLRRYVRGDFSWTAGH